MIKVLIVDDSKYVRFTLRAMLENNNFEVVGEAKDKVEAIEKFRETNPDVILMDLRMPEKGEVAEVAMSGISATKEEVIKAIEEAVER